MGGGLFPSTSVESCGHAAESAVFAYPALYCSAGHVVSNHMLESSEVPGRDIELLFSLLLGLGGLEMLPDPVHHQDAQGHVARFRRKQNSGLQ